jgi:hypothetical protein
VQRTVAPEKISRVGAFNWLSAMAFLPAGYALAGPVGAAVGLRGYLLFGAGWLVLSTIVVFTQPSVRGFRSAPVPEAAPAPAPS